MREERAGQKLIQIKHPSASLPNDPFSQKMGCFFFSKFSRYLWVKVKGKSRFLSSINTVYASASGEGTRKLRKLFRGVSVATSWRHRQRNSQVYLQCPFGSLQRLFGSIAMFFRGYPHGISRKRLSLSAIFPGVSKINSEMLQDVRNKRVADIHQRPQRRLSQEYSPVIKFWRREGKVGYLDSYHIRFLVYP